MIKRIWTTIAATAVSVLALILLFDRKRLIDSGNRRDQRIDKMLDDYHSGNLTIADAMNSLKMVLSELKGHGKR